MAAQVSTRQRRVWPGWAWRVLALVCLLLAGFAAPLAHAAPNRTQFDHLTTGFELLGQHRDLPCEACHANAIFKGTPKACAACHGVGTQIRATSKPADHILSTDQCDACHTPIAWRPAVNFDHTQTRGSCSTCHNGTQAQGKPPNHIVTDLECDACHTSLTWSGAMFTHAGVKSQCAECHDGVHGDGLAPNHFPIGATGVTPVPCEACHSTTEFTTWSVATMNHPAAKALPCALCHETAAYIGMHPSTSTAAGDSRPNASLDPNHPKSGDCGTCHGTVSFLAGATKPANHIPTSAPCAQCHTTSGNYALYSVTGTHQGVTGCLSCHGPTVGPFANVTMVTSPANHIPIGTLDCNGSGCHSTANVNPGGFKLGAASINAPTLTVAGHTTLAGAGGVSGCQSCHQSAQYLGMLAGTNTTAGDSRPTATLDPSHPASGDCNGCHTTTPTFAGDITGNGKPANHIPTSAPCAQCHTTAGTYALYSVTGTHQGVTGCLSCHGPTVGPFANVTMVTSPANHIPIGTLDCNGSGCHSTANVNPGGFLLGTASISTPTLTVAGHTTLAGAGGVSGCQSCHQSAQYLGMLAGTNTAAGDSRPTATLDKNHPTSGDCNGCHTTAPTFATDFSGGGKPANHIPTAAPCAQCHTTAGNYALYSVTGTHQGVTGCLLCHGSTVGPFANITIVTNPGNHIPIGALDCNASGCHSIANVNAGGFKLGAANINAPTLTAAGHSSVTGAGIACATCHETAPYLGMLVSTAPPGADSRPTAFDAKHPTTGDCGNCHVQTPTFATNLLPTATKPAGHIPTTAACAQCHTTAGNFAVYSVTGVHQNVTGCLSCHGPTVGPFLNVSIVTSPGNHIPIGTLDCNGSGCHSTSNVNPGGFKLGAASINTPTLTVAGHTTIAGAGGVSGCQTCHQTAAFLGMMAGTNTTAGDSRPTATLDKNHPTSGDCSGCHTTTPTFASDITGNAKPANHIPTSAPCAQCHTTAGTYALYSVTGTHQGVTGCLSCHGPTVGPFANITIVSSPANHIPIGTLDCNGSGCHSTANVNPGGFLLGTASLTTPTLTVAGHTTVAAAGGVSGCQTCHQSASFLGMIAGTNTTAGDSRPTATLDKNHPASGDCNGCHTTTPTFASDVTGSAKPANHIPTNAPCTQCHTTAGNYALYSVTGTHQGVTGCLSCHGPTVGPFANITMVTSPGNHIPIGALDCNASGCHSTANVNAGGFKLGTANINAPVLSAAGHTSVTGAGLACATCHETAPYLGMLVSTAPPGADSRPTAFDAKHPTTGDCGNCHVQTPTFATNLLPTATKPAGHIPTNAACAQCHTTAGNFAVYSVTGVHQNVTGCLSCHGPTVGPFLNVTIVTSPGNHIPIGTLDCNGSGCHSTTNVNAGGFRLGAASINAPTLTVVGHTTIAGAGGVSGCQTCHQTAAFMGMIAGTNTTAGDSRPTATLDANHPASGDCNGCHTTAPTFATDFSGGGKPANHIPTSAPCAQCHTTAGNYAVYSVTGTHQGVTSCLSCHGPTVGPFANITMVTSPGNHIPIGTLDCNGSGCHSTVNVNPGGFKLGAASINAPTLTVAGHTTIGGAGGVSGCQTCHQTAAFLGMVAGTNTTAGDSRPTATLDANHPTSGDCNGCHTTTPTFASDITGTAKPANHIPTNAPCTQCHTTAGNYALYSVTGTHQGVTGCLSCHGPTVGPFANITMVTSPGNHIPIGTLDCNGSGCHSTTNVSPGGFKLGTASITAPTLTVAGHTTVGGAGGVSGCQTCHQNAAFLGMVAGTSTTAGDSRPTATLDKNHPTSGDCNGCHTTTPTFASDITGTAKPANHIPTNAPCAQCHTTTGNYALYSVTGVHQGVTGCLSCHGPTVGPFANITMVTSPGNHIPIGALDCNSSGCHSTSNVNPGGFRLGTANINAPTLSSAGHASVTGAGLACATCHETAPYLGMLVSTAAPGADSRPTAFDAKHPTTGDCGNCHVQTPTFATNLLPTATKPTGHIPTTAACAQCHTTAGNFAVYSVTGVHQNVTACLSCHGPTVGPFLNVTMVTSPGNHIPIGTLDCNGSGCHSTTNVNAGGFRLGAASINTPTLTVAGHTTIAGAGGVSGCQTCHQTAAFMGMVAGTNTTAGDSRPTATLDKNHPASGDCNGCHTTTPTFGSDVTGSAKPANHIPTSAPCAQCHTTAGNYAVYSVTGTHQGVTGCLSCHGPTVGPFANITMVTSPGNHIPIGTLDCSGSGCHSTANVTPGGFKLGTASINTPTLTVAGHTTIAGAGGVSGCQTCHQSAQYLGMVVGTNTTAGDSRPTATLDKNHPTSGDCNGCHTTTPTFASDQTGGSKPANHIPTSAPCAQCHTTPGNDAVYSVTGVHQGVTACLSCHAPSVAATFANITIVSSPGNHIPIGTLDCNGSGCHSTANVNPGGFRLGTASIAAPTLTVAGHTTVGGAGGVSGCQTCHQSAQYLGMVVGTNTTAGDSRPTATLDKNHPTSGDCNGCHTTTPTFASDQTGGTKPANHIPTSAPCAQCHTTPGNNAVYSVTGVHQGVTACLSCHAPSVAATFANVTIVSTPANHIPIGSLDCSGSGCHTTNNVNPGGFHIGAASLTSPTLTVAGHTTIGGAGGVSGCQTCHQTAPYLGMIASTATAAGDSRPTAFDKGHPTSGDCNGCHTTTPTFSTNQSGSSAKPANHIPTNAACTQCHTTAGNYGVYVMGATGHTGITSNCAQCHAYGMSFYNMAPPTLVEPPSGATGHIPAVPPNGTGSVACELCHSPTVFTTFSGTVMRHAYVTALKCMSCHEYGMTWKTNTGVQLWTRPSPSHHAGQDCGGSGCHTSRDKYVTRAPTVRQTPTTPVAPRSGSTTARPATGAPAPAATEPGAPAARAGGVPGDTPFSHASIGGAACTSCHSPESGGGKSPTHIASKNACQNCHTTVAWLPIRQMDHTQVLGACASCHNGIIATGKASSHLPTSAACGSCHTTNAWTPARFEHAAVAPHSCTSCHNAVRAVGMPRSHIPTTQQCDSCHGTLAWTPAKVDHRTLTASCARCHNNVAVVGMTPNHLNTQVDCASCHSYPDWSELHFRHVSAAYPGEHRGQLECTSCHTTNTDKVPYASPAEAGSCAGCHAKDFKPAAHPKTLKGATYTAHELANCSGACHVYSDTTQSTIARSLRGPHHRVTDATFKR